MILSTVTNYLVMKILHRQFLCAPLFSINRSLALNTQSCKCSDLPCMFVSEKSTRLAAIIYIIFSLHPPGGTTSLPVLKELALSLKMGYWILSSLNMLHWIIANTGVDPCIQEQGLCTAFTVASLGDLEGSEPMYR